jgi:hypothetical protein
MFHDEVYRRNWGNCRMAYLSLGNPGLDTNDLYSLLSVVIGAVVLLLSSATHRTQID